MHYRVKLIYELGLFKGGLLPLARVDSDGNEICSWRFVIQEGLELDAPVIEEPWPSDKYKVVDTAGSRSLFSAFDDPTKDSYAHSLALRGPGTAFDEFAIGKERCILDIEPDAILLVECQSKIHWIQPGDLDIELILSSQSETGIGNLKGNYPDGFAVAFADGAVWFIKNSVPSGEIAKFFTVEMAKKHDRDQVLGAYILEKYPPLNFDDFGSLLHCAPCN